MKRLRITIDIEDGEPEGLAVLVALANAVKAIDRIAGQKTCKVDCWSDAPSPDVRCEWSEVKSTRRRPIDRLAHAVDSVIRKVEAGQ